MKKDAFFAINMQKAKTEITSNYSESVYKVSV